MLAASPRGPLPRGTLRRPHRCPLRRAWPGVGVRAGSRLGALATSGALLGLALALLVHSFDSALTFLASSTVPGRLLAVRVSPTDGTAWSLGPRTVLHRAPGCPHVAGPQRHRCHGRAVVVASSTSATTKVGEARSSDELWPQLWQWANSTGMDMSDIAIAVAPVDLAPGELGLIAKNDLEAGDILAWAPSSMLLSKDKALDIWGSDVADLPDRIVLMLLLIYERCIRGANSPWSTYFSGLPSFAGDVSGPSFLWEEEEWEWLEGSDAYPASVQMHNAVIDMYNGLQGLFEAKPDKFPPEAFTVQNIFWAAAIVASRAYGDDAEGSHLAIAPMVDFLNHKAGALQLTRFGNGIVAHAHKRYAQGEQVFVSYGGKNNAQLLSQYGFIDDENKGEIVFLRMREHLRIAEPHAEAKRALLEDLMDDGRPADAAILQLARRPREWQAALLPAVRILSVGAEDVLPARARDLAPSQEPRWEAAAWELLIQAIDLRDKEYPGSLEENKQQLAAGGLSERQTLSLRLRISEREHLALSRAHCSQQLEILEQVLQQSAVA